MFKFLLPCILLVTAICCYRGVSVTRAFLSPVSGSGENPAECGFVGLRVGGGWVGKSVGLKAAPLLNVKKVNWYDGLIDFIPTTPYI